MRDPRQEEHHTRGSGALYGSRPPEAAKEAGRQKRAQRPAYHGPRKVTVRSPSEAVPESRPEAPQATRGKGAPEEGGPVARPVNAGEDGRHSNDSVCGVQEDEGFPDPRHGRVRSHKRLAGADVAEAREEGCPGGGDVFCAEVADRLREDGGEYSGVEEVVERELGEAEEEEGGQGLLFSCRLRTLSAVTFGCLVVRWLFQGDQSGICPETECRS